jgi:hypothetical protein
MTPPFFLAMKYLTKITDRILGPWGVAASVVAAATLIVPHNAEVFGDILKITAGGALGAAVPYEQAKQDKQNSKDKGNEDSQE